MQCAKQDRVWARFEEVLLHKNLPEKLGLIFPGAAFSQSAIKLLASKWEQGSRSLGCSGTMFQRGAQYFSHGIGLVPEQISLKNSISQCSTESVRSSYRNCNLNCTESVKPLQNPRCFPCDLHDFAFGTMVPEHSESFSFEKQGLFRNIFRFSTKTLGVPGHFTRI